MLSDSQGSPGFFLVPKNNENCGNPHSLGDLDILRDDDEDESALYGGRMFVLAAPIRLINARHSHEISHISSNRKFEILIPCESQNNCLSFHVLKMMMSEKLAKTY